ncbi:GSCOCG00008169001-RA-CDS [Cotesia congregata]|nr:GSCOCG00008169001-RA-CDS [Cotesia congregata]
MPDDFYKFYEFCCSLSKDDPQSALRSVDLKLVGPYDVLYYYDPPEFQTILKGNDKDGLHYGYWRDESKTQPTFIAKNSANKNYKIKIANPFEKGKISRVLQTLKNYAKTHDICLEKNSAGMQKRNREVITKTLHGAGIVVPYNKKTQLGYRQLSLTDSHLIKLLHQIEKADSIDVKVYLGKLEEVVRLATIAADECDFGTPLELGHDLFSCGIEAVQRIALQMLALAYNLLKRPEFLKIAEAHISHRKKGCDLSVL